MLGIGSHLYSDLQCILAGFGQLNLLVQVPVLLVAELIHSTGSEPFNVLQLCLIIQSGYGTNNTVIRS
jgi:hypothetical protein